MSNYPTGKDNLKDNTAGTDEMTAHAELHNDANAAINAIQEFIGTSESDGSTTIVEGINTLAGYIEGIEKALGVEIEIDDDGKITITPDGGLNPDFIDIPEDETKLSRGTEDDRYDDTDDIAKAMDKKFDAGDTTAKDAKVLEDAIGLNTTNINNISDSLGGTPDENGNITIDNIDALPPQTGENGKFLTTDGDKASWGDVPEYNDQVVKDDIAQNKKDIAQKFNKDVPGGEGPTTYTTALSMESAIDHNASSISSLDTKIDKVIDDLTGGDETIDLDIASKLDRGTTNYADAAAIESAVTTLETTKAHVNHDHDLDYATKDELSTEASNRANGDAQTLQQAKDYADTISVDTSDKFDKGATTYADAGAMEIEIDKKFVDGGTETYENAKAMEDAIKSLGEKGYDDSELRGLIDDKFDDGGAVNYTSAKAMEDALGNKSDSTHTHADLAPDSHDHSGVYAEEDHTHDTTHDHDGTYQPAGDYATHDDLEAGLSGKSDTTHTHDTTHDHDGTYQPVGDYATNTDLGYLEGRVSDNETDIETNATEIGKKFNKGDGPLDYGNATILGQAVKKNKGDISTNTGNITSLSNRLDALENTSLSAEWKIRVDGEGPDTGEISLDSDVWSTVKVLHLSGKDANGVDHNFSNVKAGDTIQIGVGASGRAAGSSAAYTVGAVIAGGKFGVTHLASTGAPELGFTAIIAVYPAFDPSNYATTAELAAVDAKKYDAGVVPDTETRTYKDAYALEQAVKTNADNISTNTTNIDVNKTNIKDLIEGIGGSVGDGGNISLPGDGTPIDISGKFDKGATKYADAGEMETSISENLDAIELEVSERIEGDENALEEVAKKYNAGDVPADETRKYADAYALEKAVVSHADAIDSKVSFAVNANNENLFCNNIVTLTQAEYDALEGNRDPNTLYLAVDA